MLKKLIFICLFAVLALGISIPAGAAAVRAAVVNGQYTAEISCDDEFLIVDEAAGQETVMAKGKYFLTVTEGKLKINDCLYSGSIRIEKAGKDILPRINRKIYDGVLKACVRGGKLLVINVIELEDYLCCVLAGKTMVIWPDEAIKAQAVAARSYAVYMMRENAGKDFDISATDEELPYQGSEGKKDAVSRLVRATKGQVLTDGSGKVIRAVTTSSSGGRTEAAEGAWGYDVSYLQPAEDYDKDCPDYKWEYKISPVLLQTLLEQNGYNVGRLVSIRLSTLKMPGNDRTATGRVRNIVISGEAGTVSISGQELRRILSLNSCLFDVVITTPLPDNLEVPIENYYGMEIGRKDISIKVDDQEGSVWKNVYSSYHLFSGGKDEKVVFYGFGKGSGVGLSVWGAKGMADTWPDSNYISILKHYYQGVAVKKYY